MQERRGAFSLLLCGLENLCGQDSPWWDAVKKNAHRVKNNSRYVKIFLHGIYFDRGWGMMPNDMAQSAGEAVPCRCGVKGEGQAALALLAQTV